MRGAGRLQVVRSGSVRGLVLFRRRGERRGQLFATRRHGLDDGQGWADHGPAGGRDQGSDPARTPGNNYRELTTKFGTPCYTRIDAPATPEQKARLQKLSPEAVKESQLAGEPITAIANPRAWQHASIGGLKVMANNGWFAARPSGTEKRLQNLRRKLQGRGPLAVDCP